MNEAFATLGLLEWKPLLTSLLLPPVPLLLLTMLAWGWRGRRPGLSLILLLLSMSGLWFSQCQVTATWLERSLATAPALTPPRLDDLRRSWVPRRSVVLVLGGGAYALAPEYGEAHLSPLTMERLHYGLWLGRQLQTPVMVSGGAGRANATGPLEAEVAARVASRDYGRPLRWLETESRDTRENARRSVQLLRHEGVADVLLVTHGWHMMRALRNFEQAAARAGLVLRIVPAPMGMGTDSGLDAVRRWMPSSVGQQRVRQALREWIGWLAGA